MPEQNQSVSSSQPAEQNNIPNANLTQYSDIGGVTISFRTMPKDLEFAIARSKGVPLTPAPEKPAIPLEPIQPATPLPLIPHAEPLLPPSHLEPKSEEFLSKLAHPDDETERKLEEIKIKKVKEAEEKEKKEKIKTLYKEAKALSKDGFFNEAAKKIEELLTLHPRHWRAKWMKNRLAKKAASQQKIFEKIQTEAESSKIQITQQLKIEEMKVKEAEEKLKAETLVAQQKNAELQRAQQEKILLEQQIQSTQNNLSQIQQETEEKIRKTFEQQLQQEEKETEQEREARVAAEKQLEILQNEKAALEAKLAQEETLLLQQKETQQEAEKTALEKKKLEEEAKARQEYIQAQAKLQYQPAQNIIPQGITSAVENKITESPTPLAAKTADALSFLQTKIAKIILSALGFLAVASGIIYFVGFQWINRTNNSQTPDNQTKTESVTPAPLFAVDYTEKITLQAGQKKNLFLELEKLSGKNQEPGKFTHIIIEIISQNQEKKLMDLSDLVDSLGALFPVEILTSLGKEHTLFLYSQKEAANNPFLAGLGKNKLGLVISIEQKEKVNQQFSSWEKTMPDDLSALFLGKKISFLTSYHFLETNYQNAYIRYIELPNQISSLNYSFFNNKALITTSDESIKALIDKMTPAQ